MEVTVETIGSVLPIWSIIPFAGMLLSIALFPLFKAEWWEKNQLKVAIFWSLVFLIPFTIAYGPEIHGRKAHGNHPFGLRPVHGVAAGPVHGCRRHPSEGRFGGHHQKQRHPAGHRHAFGVVDRHHRRCHGHDSPGAARQPLASAQDAYRRVLHLLGCQHRRLPHPARRSPAVPGLPARRAVLLDAAAHLAAAAAQQHHLAGRVRHRRPSLPEEGRPRAHRQRAARDAGFQERAPARGRPYQPRVLGHHHPGRSFQRPACRRERRACRRKRALQAGR